MPSQKIQKLYYDERRFSYLHILYCKTYLAMTQPAERDESESIMIFYNANDGIYKVEMKLDEEDSFRIRNILKEESEFKKLCKIKGKSLEYKSETVLPLDGVSSRGKQKILMVFGNPAINSVDKGMFYFSKNPKEGSGGNKIVFAKHQMWSKLEKAGFIKNVDVNDEDSFKARKKEAEKRKKLILEGSTSNKYLVGLTTFYSFPTPVKGKYKNVAGVKRVFGKKLLEEIQREEIKRLQAYKHFKNACLIFAQKSTYEIYKSKVGDGSKVRYWPGVAMMRKGSGGDGLKEILKKL